MRSVNVDWVDFGSLIACRLDVFQRNMRQAQRPTICAWESAENGPEDGSMLVQRIDLDDDPVCAQVKFELKLIPAKNNLPVVSVESKWININAKWSDVGHENRAVAKLFSTLRHQDYAWGTVDALVEMQFHRETFFSIKQDQLCKILGRELRVESKWININAKWSDVGHENRAVAKLFSTLRHQDYAWGTVDALVEMQFHRETFFSIKQDQLCKILGRELRDFIINTYDGELLFPRYVLALSFEYFRNLIDAEGDVHSASVPFKKKTVLQVFEFAKRGSFSLESLKDVNDELGDFIDCLVLLRPLEYETLLYHIEMRIFEIVAKVIISSHLDHFQNKFTLHSIFSSYSTKISVILPQ
uniref:BTB domain-containing protein n=1 Tax=Ascaris lumbricoides TaxID=6252 RepID=A0A0M3ILI5_ASCLU